MPPIMEVVVVLVLSILLALVSALAGIAWGRGRRSEHRGQSWEPLIARLEAATARLEAAAASGRGGGEGPSSVEPARTIGVTTPGGPSRRRAPRGRTEPVEPEPRLIAVPDLSVAPSAEAPTAAAELTRRFGPIWELADSGASAEAIARASGYPIGQVELILGLRRHRDSAGTVGAASGDRAG